MTVSQRAKYQIAVASLLGLDAANLGEHGDAVVERMIVLRDENPSDITLPHPDDSGDPVERDAILALRA